MFRNVFDLQRFANNTTTLEDIGTHTLNGTTITTTKANTEVTLNDDGSITLAGNSGIIYNGGDNFTMNNGSFTYKSGSTTFTATPRTYPALQLLETSNNITYIKFTEPVTFDIDSNSDLDGTLTIGGIISYKSDIDSFALVYPDEAPEDDKSYAQLNIADTSLKFEIVSDTVISTLSVSDDGKLIINYPSEKYSTAKLTISGEEGDVLSDTVSINGSIEIDPTTKAISFADGTTVSATLEEIGTHTLNGTTITTTKANTEVTLNDDGSITFAADAGISIDGYPIEGTGGNVTYNKTKGTFSLTKGTVLTNTFDDLTRIITANTDAEDLIRVNSAGDFIITSNDPETLTMELINNENFDIMTISAVDGSMTYDSDNILTIGADTTLTIEVFYGYAATLSSKDGASTVKVEADRTIYTPGKGAAFTIDYLDGTVLTMTQGSIIDTYESYTLTMAAGSVFKGNDTEVDYRLEKAGNYNVNGLEITTTKDDTVIRLDNFNTVSFAANSGIVYNGAEISDAATLTDPSAGVELNNTLEAAVLSGTELNDIISNKGSNATINALGGDDEIVNIDAGGVYINTGTGNNAVTNLLNYSTVTGASDFEGVSIVGGSGNDSLYNIGGNYASITGGDGDDYISNRHGYYPTIDAGSGDDFVRISNGHYQYIDGGSGDDTITAEASVFSGGDWAMGGYATLLGGAGNDLITPVYTNNASIDGGSGNDTIITNGRDTTITGGTGNNLISLTSAETDTAESVVIAVVEGENTTIEGFKASDTLCFVDGEPNKAVELTSEGLTFWTDTVMGGSDYIKLTLPDITETTRLNLKYGTNPTITEVFIAEGGTYEVTNGAADEYVGAVATPDQGISFRGVTDDVNVVLDGSGGVGEIWNVGTAIGGDSNTTLWGSDARSDRLIAGTGRTALFGGWGSVGDTLSGSSSPSKVDGTAFVVVGNCGSDTLTNFAYGTDDTSDILLTFGAGVSAVSVRGGDVVAAIGGDSEAVFEGGVNKLIRINDGGKDWVVECGEALSYDSEVNCYGSNSATTLTIDDSAGDRVEVYGDASDGKIYHNVATVDGGGHSGRSVLVGNELGNVLTASRGGSTLWGGSGSEADTLIGGVGTDTFIYRRGNGDDVLKSVEEGDIINLLDITLEDITADKPDFFTTRLNFNGGGSLTVASLNDLSFRLSDGNTVKASVLTSRK